MKNNDLTRNIIDTSDVIIKDKDGRTALMYACISEDFGGVKSLIEQMSKDSINIQDKNGRTALMYACISGNVFIINYLLEHDANVNIKDKDGKIAFVYAYEAEIRDNINKINNNAGEYFIPSITKSLKLFKHSDRNIILEYAFSNKNKSLVDYVFGAYKYSLEEYVDIFLHLNNKCEISFDMYMYWFESYSIFLDIDTIYNLLFKFKENLGYNGCENIIKHGIKLLKTPLGCSIKQAMLKNEDLKKDYESNLDIVQKFLKEEYGETELFKTPRKNGIDYTVEFYDSYIGKNLRNVNTHIEKIGVWDSRIDNDLFNVNTDIGEYSNIETPKDKILCFERVLSLTLDFISCREELEFLRKHVETENDTINKIEELINWTETILSKVNKFLNNNKTVYTYEKLNSLNIDMSSDSYKIYAKTINTFIEEIISGLDSEKLILKILDKNSKQTDTTLLDKINFDIDLEENTSKSIIEQVDCFERIFILSLYFMSVYKNQNIVEKSQLKELKRNVGLFYKFLKDNKDLYIKHKLTALGVINDRYNREIYYTIIDGFLSKMISTTINLLIDKDKNNKRKRKTSKEGEYNNLENKKQKKDISDKDKNNKRKRETSKEDENNNLENKKQQKDASEGEFGAPFLGEKMQAITNCYNSRNNSKKIDISLYKESYTFFGSRMQSQFKFNFK